MPSLRLISIVCNDTEDVSGADEPYLRAAGRTVWGPQSLNDRESADLRDVALLPFRRSIRIDLYDEDAGWWDDDDHLGTTYAYASQAGAGERS